MGFIEQLERRRAEQLIRNKEYLEEQAKLANLEENQRRKLEEKLREKQKLESVALWNGVVPQMAYRLQEALGISPWMRIVMPTEVQLRYDYSRHPTRDIDVIVKDRYRIRRGRKEIMEQMLIHLEGVEDGSVLIGKLRLSKTDATDPNLVDEAFREAYFSADTREVFEYSPGPGEAGLYDRAGQ